MLLLSFKESNDVHTQPLLNKGVCTLYQGDFHMVQIHPTRFSICLHDTNINCHTRVNHTFVISP